MAKEVNMKKSNRAYTVNYLMKGLYDDQKSVCVLASSKEEAYDNATYEVIPNIEGSVPYSSWVYSVTYQNGNQRFFNTCSGLAY